MKRTRSMFYKESEESRELYLWTMNTVRLYKIYMEAVNSLNKKTSKGIYDSNKAIDLMYLVATSASDDYYKTFGYRFSVADRYTVACELAEDFENDYQNK